MNESQTPPKNIVLIGFMGSGKSTVGRELHHRLGYALVDMDQVIERRARKPITAIPFGTGKPTAYKPPRHISSFVSFDGI